MVLPTDVIGKWYYYVEKFNGYILRLVFWLMAILYIFKFKMAAMYDVILLFYHHNCASIGCQAGDYFNFCGQSYTSVFSLTFGNGCILTVFYVSDISRIGSR